MGRSLRSEFKEETASDANELNDTVEREVGIKKQMDPQIDAELVVDIEQPPSSGEDSDSSGADPSKDGSFRPREPQGSVTPLVSLCQVARK